jgi:dihydroorotase
MPPFRSNEDLLALQKAINDKTITAICSDHQPHNEDAKQAPFSNTQPGISSIELLLPLLMELVDKNILDLETAVSKVTSNPASILGINSGVISKGSLADLCILKNKEWKYEKSKIISSGKNSPFINKNFKTVVEKTICDGKLVYERK